MRGVLATVAGVLLTGVLVGFVYSQWRSDSAEIDDLTNADFADEIELGEWSPSDSGTDAGSDPITPALAALANESDDFPALPGWQDPGLNESASLDSAAAQWATFETTAPATISTPVWLDGTIEFVDDDDLPRSPLRQALGPPAYRR